MVANEPHNKRLVKVSIIIPVYNTEKYLERCLGSVVDQSLELVEIICIDDGSTDDSWNIIQRFAKRDKRIIAIKQDNSGPAVARNRGLKIATGEYIGFVDSDDYIDNNYFEELYKTAKRQKADIARAYVKVEAGSGDVKRAASAKANEDYFNINLKKQIQANKLNQKHVIWLAVFKRSLLLDYSINFPSDIVAGDDALFCIETSYYANKIIYVKNTGTYYHYRADRDGSIMTSFVLTEDGLLSRALVVRGTIDSLNKKSDYDKAVYVSRMVDVFLFIYQRLEQIKDRSIAKKFSQILAKSWQQTKYKEEIQKILDQHDADFTDALSSRRKIFRYTYVMSNPRNRKLKHLPKKGLKAVLPHGSLVLWRRHKARKNAPKLNYCPICEQKGEFLPMSSTGGVRPKAVCPNCSSLERHRLTWLFINRKIGLDNLKNKAMLHVAAEPSFGPKLREIVGKKYLTADMYESADVKMDITDIKYSDNSFNAIICNHVLEHVEDDAKAMKEMRRVLKKSGWAIYLVPIADMSTTYEDKKIISKKGRLEAFGQDDHVRKYGRDFIDRLKSAGYAIYVYKAKDIATKREIKRMSLQEDSKLWGFISTDIYFVKNK